MGLRGDRGAPPSQGKLERQREAGIQYRAAVTAASSVVPSQKLRQRAGRNVAQQPFSATRPSPFGQLQLREEATQLGAVR
mmetsp:Transcript_95269/g.218209  ORF Transcript_95269/g.218209 Transcript_95269/m.218209 type:complete len:80 (-) Transcript_95269:256-495(-)